MVRTKRDGTKGKTGISYWKSSRYASTQYEWTWGDVKQTELTYVVLRSLFWRPLLVIQENNEQYTSNDRADIPEPTCAFFGNVTDSFLLPVNLLLFSFPSPY